jgi:glycosyltransferase involved in cell wall biosynthesis
MTSESGTAAISIATYKRPKLLAQLLASLESMTTASSFRVIVVDNDPDGSAREVAASSTLDVDYLVEAKAGIAAARNAGLERLRDSDEYIVFVDDDEVVIESWLDLLIETCLRNDADIVAGPVISVFEPDTPRWIIRGRFIQRARFRTDDLILSPATNNTLVRVRLLRAAAPLRFDESFSMTGGSDTDFFRRLAPLKPRMVWCDEALVYEDVPPQRSTFRWIWRRGIREGNVSGRMKLRHQSRQKLFVEGAFRVGYGGALQLGQILLLRGLQARSVAYITRGIGWIGASRNRLVYEYARTPRSK